MAEPTNTFSAGEEVQSAKINQNFTESLNNYRDFTYGESIAINDTLYLKTSDGKVYKTDADFPDERILKFVGFAKESGVADDVKKVQASGKVAGLSGLTIGSFYYLSNTAGEISITEGSFSRRIGIATSTTELLLLYVSAPLFNDLLLHPSDNLRHSNDATQSEGRTDQFYKVKEIKITAGILRNCRIKFTLIQQIEAIWAVLYRNGVQIGTIRTSDNLDDIVWSEDFPAEIFEVDDLIQLYAKGTTSGGGKSASVRDLRVYYDYGVTKLMGKDLVIPIPVHYQPTITYTNQDP